MSRFPPEKTEDRGAKDIHRFLGANAVAANNAMLWPHGKPIA